MSKNNTEKFKMPSEEQLRKNIQTDVECAVAFLNMLRNDPELMKAVADVIISRLQTKAENEANEKLQFQD